MLIVGELINASRKAIAAAIEAQDQETIGKVALEQAEHGAHFIDVNAGVFVGRETDYLRWLVATVQSAVDSPCCIDSPDPEAIEVALSVHKGTAMINSISLEKERYDRIIPILAGTDLKVVALCMSDRGMPETAEDRLAIADELINRLVKNNIPPGNIYVDPLVQPVATHNTFGVECLNAIEMIMARFEGVHTICGLSNVSFGLPQRKYLNQTFVVMAVTKGLDAAIINPLDVRMMANICAAETLLGKDPYCAAYLKAYRAEKFEF
jgi:5-methyltetrahydrofolate--homocysteine methyltransferase